MSQLTYAMNKINPRLVSKLQIIQKQKLEHCRKGSIETFDISIQDGYFVMKR